MSNRPTYDAAKHLLQPSPVPSEAVAAAHACADAFAQAEKAAWDVFQDSQLAYEHPVHEQLDVLEVYADSDNRLTQAILSLGGRARRFTVRDGDLSTIEGQRRLWDVLQETQPKHVWMSPSCRAWCSWSMLGSRASFPSVSDTLQGHCPLAVVCPDISVANGPWPTLPSRTDSPI